MNTCVSQQRTRCNKAQSSVVLGWCRQAACRSPPHKTHWQGRGSAQASPSHDGGKIPARLAFSTTFYSHPHVTSRIVQACCCCLLSCGTATERFVMADIHTAARNGDMAAVVEVVSSDPTTVTKTDKHSRCAGWRALVAGRHLSFLCLHRTALHLAAFAGRAEIARLLVSFGFVGLMHS